MATRGFGVFNKDALIVNNEKIFDSEGNALLTNQDIIDKFGTLQHAKLVDENEKKLEDLVAHHIAEHLRPRRASFSEEV